MCWTTRRRHRGQQYVSLQYSPSSSACGSQLDGLATNYARYARSSIPAQEFGQFSSGYTPPGRRARARFTPQTHPRSRIWTVRGEDPYLTRGPIRRTPTQEFGQFSRSGGSYIATGVHEWTFAPITAQEFGQFLCRVDFTSQTGTRAASSTHPCSRIRRKDMSGRREVDNLRQRRSRATSS